MSHLMTAECIRKTLGYSVNKKSWTRSQHQQALFCRAMESFPELYDITHPDYSDLKKVETSWKKLALVRKRIYGDDEAILTFAELNEIWSDMSEKFEVLYFEVSKKVACQYGEVHDLKPLLKLGDERLSYFSHMFFTVSALALAWPELQVMPGPKMIERDVGWVVVHSDGKEEPLNKLSAASRKKISKEVLKFSDELPLRVENIKDRKEITMLEIQWENMMTVCDMAKLTLESEDEED